ncbi:recombinase family protein [Rhodococcus spongiicola]|uniref:recombinase family protein n=1 Tax=Rhodococcus spongiicola TaxID=2487352 RepID=UPI001F454739|nr:recombinase family protein [Rhodococcus spongiicola]
MEKVIEAALAKAERARKKKNSAETAVPGTAVAYLRVSTKEQRISGAGIGAQRAAIEAAAEREGWTITAWHSDEGISGGKGPAERPGLAAALADITSGRAERMIVHKVDRLSRKFSDSVMLMEAAITEGWPLYVVAQSASTHDQHGRFLLRLFANLAEDERDTIRQRTRDALAVKKAQGVRLGRPSVLSDEVVTRIVLAHRGGAGYARIANDLNRAQVPTARGGKIWHPSTVRSVLAGQDAARISRELSEAGGQ